MTAVAAPADAAWTISALCGAAGVRLPDIIGEPGAAVIALTWLPDLTPAEQAKVTDIVSAGRSHVGINLAEWLSIKDDAAGLVTFQGLASPTLAQTVSAVKAQSRILRALLRS